MPLIWEKIVVTAKEFVHSRNINDCHEFNEPFFQTKIKEFDWDLSFSAASIGCEIIWRIGIGRGRPSIGRQFDRLFSPSPVSTHANFRGSKGYKTGNVPEPGAIAIWKRGNSWQGNMAIVTAVSDDKKLFDVVETRVLEGSENKFLRLDEKKDKRMDLPFRNDKLNLVGFIYPPSIDIE